MKNKDEITSFINMNKTRFQVNTYFLKPRRKILVDDAITERMINIDKYQTKEIVIDFFYKKISRTLK